jgi:CRISPR type III-A-associated protein Csm2
MADEEVQQEATTVVETTQEPPKQEPPRAEPPKPEGQKRREDRPPRPQGENQRPQGENQRPQGEQKRDRPRDERRDDRRDDRRGEHKGERREGGRPGGRPFEGPPEIELEKLISDSLYLDNQAHAIVARMRDMDSGTKSQLRRLYNAVRRAVRAPENEKQHQFVMLRARLAYTIARHSLRSLDALERLLLQVTRKNDAKGYERFKDLFEAIVAYNE